MLNTPQYLPCENLWKDSLQCYFGCPLLSIDRWPIMNYKTAWLKILGLTSMLIPCGCLTPYITGSGCSCLCPVNVFVMFQLTRSFVRCQLRHQKYDLTTLYDCTNAAQKLRQNELLELLQHGSLFYLL